MVVPSAMTFPNEEVGANAAIEEVSRERLEKLGYGRQQKMKVIKDIYSLHHVETGTPGMRLAREKLYPGGNEDQEVRRAEQLSKHPST
jgi:L-ribulose-5-phosphate 3-epimerase UlaE